MTAHPIPPTRPEQFVLIRALLLVQIGVIVTATVESMVLGLVAGSLALPVLNGSFAVWTMFLMRGVGRGSPRGRIWLVRLQIGWLALAAVDMVLALVLAERGLEPVPVATRIVVPALLIHLLHQPEVRREFEAAS